MSTTTAPTELPRPPRTVADRSSRFLRWYALLFTTLWIGLGLTALGGWMIICSASLFGSRVDGIVRSAQVSRGKYGTACRGSADYEVRGHSHTATVVLPMEDCTRHVGETVPLERIGFPFEYASERHSLADLVPILPLGLLPIGWCLVWAHSAWRYFFLPLRHRRLLRSGAACTGQLVAVAPVSRVRSPRRNRGSRIALTVHFRDAHGAERSFTQTVTTKAPPSTGQVLTVLADAKHAVLLDYAAYRIVTDTERT